MVRKKHMVLFPLATLYFALQYVFTNDSVAVYILGGIAILIFALAGLSNLRFSFERFPLMMLAFVVFCILSYTWAERPNLALNRGLSMLKIYVMILLLYVSMKNNLDTRQLLKIVMWGGFFAITYTISTVGVTEIALMVEMAERLGEDEELFINVNVLGTLAANVIIINIYFKLFERFSWDILIVFPCLTMVAVCGSRRAMIVLFVGVVVLLLLKIYRKLDVLFFIKVSLITILTAVLIHFTLTLPLFAVVAERMEGLINSIKGEGVVDNSTLSREMMIEVGYKLFQESPIVGIGLDNARAFNVKVGSYLHNNYVELAADLGIIGIILYYSMHLYVIVITIKYWKYDKRLSSIVLTLMLSLLISDIGVVSYYYKEYYFYLLLSFIFIKETNHKKKTNGFLR